MQYPVRWTAQSALHFSSPDRPVHSDTNSASLGSSLAMQQLRAKTKSLPCPPLSITRYSFIQLSLLRRREENENAQTSKRLQRGFEPGLSRLRVRHSTTELPRSTQLRRWLQEECQNKVCTNFHLCLGTSEGRRFLWLSL